MPRSPVRRDSCASILNLPRDQVFPVSAQRGWWRRSMPMLRCCPAAGCRNWNARSPGVDSRRSAKLSATIRKASSTSSTCGPAHCSNRDWQACASNSAR